MKRNFILIAVIVLLSQINHTYLSEAIVIPSEYITPIVELVYRSQPRCSRQEIAGIEHTLAGLRALYRRNGCTSTVCTGNCPRDARLIDYFRKKLAYCTGDIDHPTPPVYPNGGSNSCSDDSGLVETNEAP